LRGSVQAIARRAGGGLASGAGNRQLTMNTPLDLRSLAAHLATRSLSVVDHVHATLDDIAARNASLNIYTWLDQAGALAAARASDARHATGATLSVLDGAILAVKDNIDVAGLPTTAGLGFRRDRIAGADAFVVARLRAAGAIVLGKVNMHAAAFGATTRNADFGDCANPTHPGRVAGGSSGGSAAALAAGWAQLALGTDTMGSVRIPASYCGVAGIKPSAGTISCGGVLPLCARLDHVGLLARNAPDLALALPLAAGFDAADPAARRFGPLSPLAIPSTARAPRAPLGSDVEPGIWARFEAALQAIERLGCVVERFDAPPCDLGRLRRAGLLMTGSEMLVIYETDWREKRAAFPAEMAATMTWAEGKSARDMARALTLMDSGIPLQRHLQGTAQCLLLPTSPLSPFSNDLPAPANQADLTVLPNISGSPAASVPMPCEAGELSAGLQIIGREGDDMAVLALAGAYQEAMAG